MDKTKPTYLTVVYKIDDKDKAKNMLDEIIEKFSYGCTRNGYSIVAASRDNEIQRLELIEQIAERDGNIEILEVLSSINVMDIKL